MQPSNPADERPTDDEKDEQAREWLESRGCVVMMPDDWRETPPDEVGRWWAELDTGVICRVNIDDPSDGLGLVADVNGTWERLSSFSDCVRRWCPARYATPPKGE